MVLGQYEYEQRQRRLVVLRVAKILVAVVVVASVGMFSYQYAFERVKGRETKREQDIQALTQQVTGLEIAAEQLQQTVRKADARVHELEAKLAHDVPSGDRARLFEALNERLEAGVHPDRLAFVIRNARMPTNCSVTENKRVVVATSARLRSATRTVTVGGGLLTLTAEGEPVRDRSGSSEGWFDPARPVTINISPVAKEQPAVIPPQQASGVLPLRNSVVTGNREVRLSFKAGARSYIDITVETCDFP
jgi:hypothetical protein